jgi:hypothetical protein
VARATAAGQPDATFGTGGVKTFTVHGFSNGAVNGVAVNDAASRIYAGGAVSVTNLNTTTYSIFVASLLEA